MLRIYRGHSIRGLTRHLGVSWNGHTHVPVFLKTGI